MQRPICARPCALARRGRLLDGHPDKVMIDCAANNSVLLSSSDGTNRVPQTDLPKMKLVTRAILVLLAPFAWHFGWAAAVPIQEFPLVANHLQPDPARGRIYATIPASNSIVVIDTASLGITNTIFVGSGPNDMAMSPDGGKLYVTLTTASQIAVVDLNTLSALPSLTVSGRPYRNRGRSGRQIVHFDAGTIRRSFAN